MQQMTLAGEEVLLVLCSTTALVLRDSVCSALLVAIFVSYWRHCRPKGSEAGMLLSCRGGKQAAQMASAVPDSQELETCPICFWQRLCQSLQT